MEGPLATLNATSPSGGANWPGGSYDPETHMLYVFSQSRVTALGLVPAPPGTSDMRYIQGTATTGPRPAGGLARVRAPMHQHRRGRQLRHAELAAEG